MRGYTLMETLAAMWLVLVLLGGLFPPPGPELALVRGRFEREVVRLILEGELEVARDEARRGALSAGERPASGYGSAARLDGLRLERRVEPAGPEQLRTVVVIATWRTRLPERPGGDLERRLALSTWVEAP